MTTFNDEQIRKQFDRDISREDIRKAVEQSDNIIKKVEGGFLKKELAKIKLLTMLVKDAWNGVYNELPWHTMVAIVIVLLYILNPIDLAPDFIPVAGQIDDLAVLYFAWRMIGEDVKDYAKWKIERGDTSVVKLYEQAFS